jgi:predicted RNase H-like HicB family nuclease
MTRAFIEQGKDGYWSAWVDVDGALVGGQGDTQESAKADLIVAIKHTRDYLAESGKIVPELADERSFELLTSDAGRT